MPGSLFRVVRVLLLVVASRESKKDAEAEKEHGFLHERCRCAWTALRADEEEDVGGSGALRLLVSTQ